MHRPSRFALLGLTYVTLGSAAIVGGLVVYHHMTCATVRTVVRAEARTDAQAAAKRVQATFQRVYTGLRTMARLPGVQRHLAEGVTPDDQSRQVLQELYQALAADVAMYEVYLVPANLDPDRSGGRTAPTMAFHETLAHQESKTPEVEIYEYRLMRAQLAWLAEHAVRCEPGKEPQLPAVLGAPVVTCDNSRYHPDRPDDEDRRGLVYSVPVFGAKGQLLGMVSGVILNHVVRDLLNDPRASLVSSVHRARIAAIGTSNTVVDEDLPVDLHDATGPWRLQYSLPEDLLAGNREAQAADRFLLGALAGTSTITFLLMGGLLLTDRRRQREAGQVAHILEALRAAEQGNHQARCALEGTDVLAKAGQGVDRLLDAQASMLTALHEAGDQLERASVELNTLADRLAGTAQEGSHGTGTAVAAAGTLETAVGGVASAIAQLEAGTGQIASNTEDLASRAAEVRRSVDDVQGVMTRLQEHGGSIGTSVTNIRDIAGRTRMLALNASIQASRAGEAGRGFAVVAREIEDLARQVDASSLDIAQRIQDILANAGTAGEAVTAVQAAIHEVDARLASIAGISTEQATSVSGIGTTARDAATASKDLAGALHQVESSIAATATASTQLPQRVEALRNLAGRIASLLRRSAS